MKHFVGKICKCVQDKRPVRLPQAPQKSITSAAPMELVGLDFLPCAGGFQYLLVITDHFIRYTQVYPTRNKEAKTAAEKLFNDYILRFGMPGKIIHDPQCNGQVERMNQSIISMLETLESTEKKSWKSHINKLAHAYNCTKKSSTGMHHTFFCLDENRICQTI